MHKCFIWTEQAIVRNIYVYTNTSMQYQDINDDIKWYMGGLGGNKGNRKILNEIIILKLYIHM